MNAGAYLSGSVIIRCTSSLVLVTLRSASTTSGPMVMFGTKWPSMTSTCRVLQPAASSGEIESPSRAKSAERIDGRISTMGDLQCWTYLQCYHGPHGAIGYQLSARNRRGGG